MAINSNAPPEQFPWNEDCVLMCMLDLDAGFSADLLSLELIAVPLTAAEPELSAGVSYGVIVPLHHVVPARSRIKGEAAALI